MKKTSNIQWLWLYYRPYQIKFIVLVAISMGLTVLLTWNPKLIGQFVEDVIVQGDWSNAGIILGAIVSITAINTFGKYGYLLMFQSMAQDVIFDVRHDLYRKIQTMDQTTIKANRTGTLMSRMIGDTQLIVNFLSFSLQEIIVNCIMVVVILIMMYRVNPFFLLSFLIPMPFFFLVGLSHSKKVRPGFEKIREKYSILNTVVQENVSGNRVVRAFMNESFEYAKFDEANTGFREANLESVDVWRRFVPIIDGTGMIMSGILILVGGLLYSVDAIRLSDIIQMAAYLSLLDKPLRSFGWTINKVQQLLASTEKVREVMDSGPVRGQDDYVQKAVEDRGLNKRNQSTSGDVPELRGDIVFDHVSFDYGQGTVIDDFNLEIPWGTTMAFVGATGSGKSTIIDLLARFYQVSKGEIRICDRAIQDYDLHYLRQQMAMSLQSVFLFSDTIENNIRYGYPSANEEEIYDVADISGVSEFVNKMPQGYETVIGENGVGLSGGQKQRIALARALIKNPSILILDDTTSSVDIATEYKIHQGLKNMKAQRTTLLVAHRISSIRHADEIIVMDQGKIIERGTHKELVGRKGHYYEVLKNQMGDFDLSLNQTAMEGEISL